MSHGDGLVDEQSVLRDIMIYTVVIHESDEGFAVSVPGLPGCHSQGETEADAVANTVIAVDGSAL